MLLSCGSGSHRVIGGAVCASSSRWELKPDQESARLQLSLAGGSSPECAAASRRAEENRVGGRRAVPGAPRRGGRGRPGAADCAAVGSASPFLPLRPRALPPLPFPLPRPDPQLLRVRSL
ncbi:unnamed protein product [Rangifer tarandus platyrhynchus]|uniref:Uncharacterized protein n=2 Tax=Rangifer tarandus platyrhynchus TaxID=3082113 RepID=A0ACB0E2X3_RANTA|nr:unnamed protein product [Rangifer tarandus platyrhynchus]CAI9694831.1 unnamed protein product [Rangifer tarandus platyrhynchus]